MILLKIILLRYSQKSDKTCTKLMYILSPFFFFYSTSWIIYFILINRCANFSIADIWRNVLTNMSDFKELVPEFYDVDNEGDFLVNKCGINFGFRHDGTRVGDVSLPPWTNSE